MRDTLRRVEEVGNRRAIALCCHVLGAVQYLLGRWDESLANLERSVEQSRAIGSIFGDVLGEQRLALLETALGRVDSAHERLRRALALAQGSEDMMVRFHGIIRLLATAACNRFEAGDLAQATEYLAQGLAAQQRTGECVTCDVLMYPAAVPIYLALGDRDQAEEACRRAEHAATAFGSRAWTATAHHLRGLLATARADWPAAVGNFEAAVDLFEALGQRYDVARSLEALAGAASRAGYPLPQPPAALRQRAAELYAALGAGVDARRF